MADVKFSLLKQKGQRPVISLNYGETCIFDTGAYVNSLVPDCLASNGNYAVLGAINVGGFGGPGHLMPLIRYDEFTLKQDNVVLKLLNAEFVVSTSLKYSYLLSPRHFSKYLVNNDKLVMLLETIDDNYEYNSVIGDTTVYRMSKETERKFRANPYMTLKVTK